MKSSELLSCILVLVTEGIFCRCEGRFNSSSSATFSRKNSFSPSPSWTSWCSSSTSATPNNVSNVISPNRTSIAATKYRTSLTVTTAASVSPTSSSVSSQAVQPGRPPSPQLTSFGIFLVTFGGVLVAFMIFALIWICCRGREKSPQGPHTQVKLKPWGRARKQSLNDVTIEESDHPTSYQNQGLNSPNPNSPLSGNSNAVSGTVKNIRESPLI